MRYPEQNVFNTAYTATEILTREQVLSDMILHVDTPYGCGWQDAVSLAAMQAIRMVHTNSGAQDAATSTLSKALTRNFELWAWRSKIPIALPADVAKFFDELEFKDACERLSVKLIEDPINVDNPIYTVRRAYDVLEYNVSRINWQEFVATVINDCCHESVAIPDYWETRQTLIGKMVAFANILQDTTLQQQSTQLMLQTFCVKKPNTLDIDWDVMNLFTYDNRRANCYFCADADQFRNDLTEKLTAFTNHDR